jgi:ribosomal protein L30E
MFQSCQINMEQGNKNGNFSYWPGLTEHYVEKHLSKSTSTTKVHLNQQRQNARTIKIKDAKVIITEPDVDHGIKTQFVYTATIAAGQIYTDQTCRFPVVSSKGNKYIMILYDYDSNAILAQPIKDRTAPELLKLNLIIYFNCACTKLIMTHKGQNRPGATIPSSCERGAMRTGYPTPSRP